MSAVRASQIASTYTVENSVETRSPAKCAISKRLRYFQPFFRARHVSISFAATYGRPTSVDHRLRDPGLQTRYSDICTALQRFRSKIVSVFAFFPANLWLITRYLGRLFRGEFRPVDACSSQVYSETRLVAGPDFGFLPLSPDESSEYTHVAAHFLCSCSHSRPAHAQPQCRFVGLAHPL